MLRATPYRAVAPLALSDGESGCPRTRSIRVLLATLAPATLLTAPVTVYERWSQHPTLLVCGLGAALLIAAARHRLGVVWPRALASAAVGAWAAGTLLTRPQDPAHGLAVLLGLVAVLAFVWPVERLRAFAAAKHTVHRQREVLLACGIALMFGVAGGGDAARGEWLNGAALTALWLTPAGLAWRQRGSLGRRGRWLLWVALICALLPVIGSVLGGNVSASLAPLGLLSGVLLGGLMSVYALRRWMASTRTRRETGLLDAVLLHPSRILVFSFLGLCVAGTVLLSLPMSAASGERLAWIDMAFTSVSATCVTGLIVVDTPMAFSGFGQVIVLLLFQVGGLGIMVFSAAALVMLGRRLSLSHERAAVDLVGADGRAGLMRAVRLVLRVTLITEAASAALLFIAFLVDGDGVGMAAWRAIFTAVSAFCNAGFALQSDSLVPYADNPVVLGVVGLTIVVGGLGPPVVAALLSRRGSARHSLHVRLVVWTTVILVCVPTGLIVATEWNGTLAGLSVIDKLTNATFQAVTLRTAGFNSIDLAQVQPATWTLMVLLMFVGGSPGSTAGGVKTTTVAVAVLAIMAAMRGRGQVEAFGRTLPAEVLLRALAVLALGALGCGLALVLIQLTQTFSLDVATFEVVSALATVGLSTGGTGALDQVGKAIIIACMFAGRVGPLTLFVFLASSATRQARTRAPEESVPIG